MDFAAHSDFDVVYVVENAADYAAFQSIRKAASTEGRDEARRLAELIAGGDVALLLGAGVSISAGLPTWINLLGQLKDTLLPDLDPEVFSELGVLDQAQLLANSSPSKALGHSVSQLIKSAGVKKPTLSHCLLASLNVAKVVTTNYDSLYENAFNSAHRSVSISVLPRGDVVADQPWLLKMHGDVEDPDSIVLSRRDFVKYDAERRPLGSIVQSLMSTGHLVAIGASMTDDNVLRLAHEVLAINAKYDQERVLGEVITLRQDAIQSALWKGNFDFIPASTAPNDRVAARDLEILLDRVQESLGGAQRGHRRIGAYAERRVAISLWYATTGTQHRVQLSIQTPMCHSPLPQQTGGRISRHLPQTGTRDVSPSGTKKLSKWLICL